MSVEDDVHEVQKVFPDAYCISYKDKYCVAWAFDLEPIIAVAKKPRAAWRAAARLVHGKNKKQLEKLKKKILEVEAEKAKP